MRRTLFNLAAVTSVLLGVTVCVLWGRSWDNSRQGDQLRFTLDQGRFELSSQGGGLALSRLELWYFSGPSTGGKVVPRYNTRDLFNIAWWIPLIITIPLPTIWLIRWNRLRHRITAGLCLHCGYDLRASALRCPECGQPPAPQHATAA